MSRFNSRKIALIGLKGEKGEPGDSGVLKGAGAPTTETIGEIGKFYVDTTSGTSYQCKSIVDGVYTWVEMVDKEQLDTKLDKVTTTHKSKARAYIVNPDGTQAVEELSPSPSGNAIPRYDGGGRISTITPTSPNHCANKKYVDDNKGTKSYKHTFTIYGDDTDVGITDAVVGEGYFYSTSQALDMVVLSGNTLSIDSDSLLTITSNIFAFDYTNEPIGTYTLEGTWYKDITSSYTLRRVVDVATEV